MIDLKNLLSNIAPAITTALSIGGSPAAVAIKFLSNTFFGKPDATQEEVTQAINSATPEQLVKLKELDANFAIEMGKQGVNLYSLEVQDRSNARTREVELAKAGKSDYLSPFIVFVIFIGFFIIVFMILKEPNGIPQASKDVIYMIIGLLGAKISSIVDYFFGSSSSSRQKDDILKNKLEK